MILVSAGHHPDARGAGFKGFYEYPETKYWVDGVMAHLSSLALPVPTGKLGQKVDFINQQPEVDMAVEIHFNQTPNGLPSNAKKWSGALTLYMPGSTKGKQLAEAVQFELEGIYGRHWHGVAEGWYRMDKKNGPDYFLSKTKCPAIIIEPEFIFRKELIQETREEACKGIANGILKTLEAWHSG